MARRYVRSSSNSIVIDTPMSEVVADVVWSSRMYDVKIVDSCSRATLELASRDDAKQLMMLLRKQALALAAKDPVGAEECTALADLIERKL